MDRRAEEKGEGKRIMLKKETLKEIGKHFLTLATVFLSVGLITPLFKKEELSVINLVFGFGFWFVLFLLGVYLINKGSEDG